MSQQDYDNGLKVRTEVMGESFVKRALSKTEKLGVKILMGKPYATWRVGVCCFRIH